MILETLKKVSQLQNKADKLRESADKIDNKASKIMEDNFGICDGRILSTHIFVKAIYKIFNKLKEEK